MKWVAGFEFHLSLWKLDVLNVPDLQADNNHRGKKPIDFCEHMHEEKYIEDFLTTETWLQDNIPVPGEVYREFVKYLYQQNLLTNGRLPVGKYTVNLGNITCPVLNLMGKQDDLVACGQSAPFNDLVGSKVRKSHPDEGLRPYRPGNRRSCTTRTLAPGLRLARETE
jgi:hypothetical protein